VLLELIALEPPAESQPQSSLPLVSAATSVFTGMDSAPTVSFELMLMSNPMA
jgi:hypothetical protein